MERVPREVLDELWAKYCTSLAPLHYDGNEAVESVWKLFYPALEAAPLETNRVASAGCTSNQVITHSFTIDFRHAAVTPAMIAALISEPLLVTPLLTFFRCVLEYQRRTIDPRQTTAAQFRVACLVRADEQQRANYDDLGAALLNRLVSVRGTVVRLTPARIVCIHIVYRCGLCGAIKEETPEDGTLLFPGPCAGRCRGYRWVPVQERAVCEEVQLLKLQEQSDSGDAGGTTTTTTSSVAGGQGGASSAGASPSGGGGSGAAGGINKVIAVELRAPLIDAVAAGELVTVTGILSTYRGEQNAQAPGTYQICLKACDVASTNVEANSVESATGSGPLALNTSLDWAMEGGRFYEMVRHPQWFARLVASVAPSLFGLESVKTALLLAVIGGSTKRKSLRSNIHMLLLGDPGLGKSQLLRAACTIAPRSSFVCAHTSSSCGLTVSLSRDPTSGETTFEAGAVVHGDGGVTCIDEIDKGTSEHKALLEVMEQESVSIAKAGMVFSMPIRTSIIAAGNPVGGKFDETKSVSANINMSPALTSRFDLLFCLRDNAARVDRTAGLTSHILQMHRAAKKQTLVTPESSGTTFPLDLVRRFVFFARNYCHPVLSVEACVILKEYYLLRRRQSAETLRNAGAVGVVSDVPVTPRFLQAIIRVSEARAKAELRSEVTRDDALFAVNLMDECTASLGAAATAARIDGRRSGTGGVARKKTQREIVVDLLRAQQSATGQEKLSYLEIIVACEEAGCKNPNAMLHQLNEYGILLQAGDKYKLNAK